MPIFSGFKFTSVADAEELIRLVASHPSNGLSLPELGLYLVGQDDQSSTDLNQANLDTRLIFSSLGVDGQVEFYELELKKETDLTDALVLPDVYIYDLKEAYKKLSETKIQVGFRSLCLMLASFLENSLSKFDLESLVFRFIDVALIEELKVHFQTQEKLSKEHIYSLYSLLLGQHFAQLLPKAIYKLWLDIESPLAISLARMELRGVFIDRDKLKELSDTLEVSAGQLQESILQTLKQPNLNLNSPSQLGLALKQFGFKLKSTASGKISTDREVLDNLSLEDETGVIEQIIDYRTVTKLFSTYTDSFLKLLDQNDRIHGSYNQVQAPTGRLSANNPNLQNIPIRHPVYGPLIRGTFAAPSGRLLVGADYSQMELRLLAHFSQDPILIEAFKEGQDIHQRTAAEIYDISLDEVTTDQRRVGKTLNFALLYQQGVTATAKQLKIKVKEANEVVEKYFSRFPNIKPFIQEVLASTRKNSYVETIYGRRRYFENLNSPIDFVRKAEERAAFNTVLQGSNADLIKQAMLDLERKLKQDKLTGFIILQVHDELVLEVDKDDAEKIKALVVEAMEVKQPLNVPIVVEAKIGQNWAETK